MSFLLYPISSFSAFLQFYGIVQPKCVTGHTYGQETDAPVTSSGRHKSPLQKFYLIFKIILTKMNFLFTPPYRSHVSSSCVMYLCLSLPSLFSLPSTVANCFRKLSFLRLHLRTFAHLYHHQPPPNTERRK